MEILLYVIYVIVDKDKSKKETPKKYFIIVGMLICLLVITISHAKNDEINALTAKAHPYFSMTFSIDFSITLVLPEFLIACLIALS